MLHMILIYKKANKIGYKAAKRRFKIELKNMVIAVIVLVCEENVDSFETLKMVGISFD